MKVLLINPPDRQIMFIELPDFMRRADSTTHLPPLGLLYIASYLITHTNHEVIILDAQLEDLTYDDIEEKIRQCKPDIVGISAYTLNFLDTFEIAHRVKLVNPETIVIIGGPHTFIYPAQTAMLPYIDIVAPGEGEEVMTEIVNAIANHESLKNIPGLYFRNNGDLITTAYRPQIANLDDIPFPARKLLSLEAYKFITDTSKFSTTMISTRGCKFKCTFCDTPFRSIRARSSSNVALEMAECALLGYKEINFYDDNFNFSEEHVEDLSKEIIKRNINVQFGIRARVDKINSKILKLLYNAGCRRISFGVEAGDDETLRYLKKGITTKMVRNAVKLTQETGIEVATFFILGIPGRSGDISLRTIDFAIELDPDYAQFMYMVLLPGTELYTKAIESGAIERDFYLDFAVHPSKQNTKAYWENPLSFTEAQDLTKLAYKRFYLRPKYILKSLKKIRNINELIRKSQEALYIFSYSISPRKKLYKT